MKWLVAMGVLLFLPFTMVQAQNEGVIDLESRRPDEVLTTQLPDSRLVYLMVYHKELIVAVTDTALQPMQTVHLVREKKMRQAIPVSISGTGDSILIYTYDTREREYGCHVVNLSTGASTFSNIRKNSNSEKYLKTISWKGETYLLTVLEDNNRLLVRRVLGAQVYSELYSRSPRLLYETCGGL